MSLYIPAPHFGTPNNLNCKIINVVVAVLVIIMKIIIVITTTTTYAEILPSSLASSEMQAQLLSVLLHSLGTFLPFLLQQLLIPVLIISSHHFSFFS